VRGLTSIEDTTKKEGELCLGVLSGIYWKISPDLWEKLEEGFELIPGKLRLRIFTEKDRELFTLISPSFELQLMFGQEKNTVIELKNASTKELFETEFDPLTKALLAFRLLKAGGIFLDSVIAIERGMIRRIIYPSHPEFLPAYEFSLGEIKNLIAVLEKVQKVDLDKNSPFRIACTRFGRSYLDRFDEDKLIDLCIAFEALFLQGKRTRAPMGQVIGLACSMLLGKNIDERKMIKENSELAFSCRNDVVHGQDFDFDQIYNLIPDIEGYLRKSIFHLMQ